MSKITQTPKVLIVDDDQLNLVLLAEYIANAGYESMSVENGSLALEAINNTHFDVILLDRMMPDMDGIEVLKNIKANPELESLPVIIQTAKVDKPDIQEGLDAGANYYVTKPLNKDALLSIVKTAIDDYRRLLSLKDDIDQTTGALSLLETGKFVFKTLEQAMPLATILANTSHEPDKLALGLTEIFINAIEHGNLGISYDEKSELIAKGGWHDELLLRASMPEYSERTVTVEFNKLDSELHFLICDEGDGFDWKQYLEISSDRAFHTHGRGIATANSFSFDKLEYRGKGNEVLAVVAIKPFDT